jgi:hypothetical protein
MSWRLASDGMWYDGISHADVASADYGFQFDCLYAPVHSLKQWTILRLEVKKVYDSVRKHWYRAYVVKTRRELQDAPFEWVPTIVPYETPKQESDWSAEFSDYVTGAEPSEGVRRKLEEMKAAA